MSSHVSRLILVCAAAQLVACGSQPGRPAPAPVQAGPSPNSSPEPATPAATEPDPCLADSLELGPFDPNAPRSDCRNQSSNDCLEACKAGEHAACVELGYRLEREPDKLELAQKVYREACRQGNHNGCTNYAAHLLRSDRSSAADRACAVRIFRVNCEVREHYACGMIAVSFERGEGVEQSRSQALALAERYCAELGNFPCVVLGELREREGDLAGARQAYRDGCSSGYAPSCAEADRLGP